MISRIKRAIRNITPYIFTRFNAKLIGGGAILTGVGIGLEFLGPYLFSQLVSTFISESATTTILGVEFSPLALIVTARVATYGTKFVSNYTNMFLAPLGPRAKGKLILDYVDRTVNQSMQSFRETKAGTRVFDIQSTFRMEEVSTQICTQVIPTIFRVTIGGILLSKNYGSQFGLGLGGIVVLYTGYNIATKKIITNSRDIIQKLGNENYNDVCRVMSNPETTQLFNNEEFEMKRIRKSLDSFLNADIKFMRTFNKVAIGQDTITEIGQTILLILAVDAVSSKSLKVQDLILISNYLAQFFSPLSAFGSAVNQVVSGATVLEKIFKHMKKARPISDKHRNTQLELKEAKIEFKDVKFTYPKRKKEKKSDQDEKKPTISHEIFQNISFVARGGEKIGIVGSTGAGKSTIGKLLYRFYDATSGSILIDDQDIKSVGLKHLRSKITVIQQHSVVTDGTIRDNIVYGELAGTVTDDDLRDVAKIACLDFVMQRKDGFKTKIGDGGDDLSGGQKQRIAIARALLKKAQIIILDEATASLDPATEKMVQANIDNFCKRKKITELVITHKLSNVEDADRIIVIDKGFVVEQGTHSELLAKKGFYYNLWMTPPSENSAPTTESKKGTLLEGLNLFLPIRTAITGKEVAIDIKDDPAPDKVVFHSQQHSGK